jgi:hypothetical protein
MEPQEYLKHLCRQLAHELTAHDKIRAFVGRHPDLIGNYAEASTRDFISRVVTPLKVSTGTILYETNYGKEPPQLDAIVWSPNPAPAIFEGGNFAIVPRGSAHGFIEIKSKAYSSKVGKDIVQKLSHERDLIHPRLKDFIPGWGDHFYALGVVCVATRPDKTLRQLVEQKRAAILLDMDDNNEVSPNIDGIWTLVNFLILLRRRARLIEAVQDVNYLPVSPDAPQPRLVKQRNSQTRNGRKAKAGR